MKVRELIKELRKLDPELDVYIEVEHQKYSTDLSVSESFFVDEDGEVSPAADDDAEGGEYDMDNIFRAVWII